MADDFAQVSSSNGRVFVGAAPSSGQSEIAGDTDWFGIDLVGGLNYGFTLNSASVNGVPDPYLRLYDSGGSCISADDDSGGGLNSRLLFRPASSGCFFFMSAANVGNSGTGAYLIAQQVVLAFDPDGAGPMAAVPVVWLGPRTPLAPTDIGVGG